MEERNYGIDALRMFSMFLVVILHVLGCGGVLAALEPQSTAYFFAWSLEYTAFCAVNCYALITGFVMYGRRTGLGKFCSLWLSVLFWSVLMSVVVWCYLPETLDFASVARAIFPITNHQYWYISAYALLYLLMPVLQIAIEHLSDVAYTTIVFGSFLLVCGGTFLSGIDAFQMVGGYSPIWLILCFLWGGWLRKYRIPEKVRGIWGVLLFIGSVCITIFFRYLMEAKLDVLEHSGSFTSYTSPFMVLAAVGLLLAFYRLPTTVFAKRAIAYLSPAALGVYLIHTHSLVFAHIVADFAISFATYSVPTMLLAVLGAALGIYAACTVLELLRIQLFRLLRVSRFCKWLDVIAGKCVARFVKEETESER